MMNTYLLFTLVLLNIALLIALFRRRSTVDPAALQPFFDGVLGEVRIREDSTWNVPEPELTLVVTSS